VILVDKVPNMLKTDEYVVWIRHRIKREVKFGRRNLYV